MYKVINELIAFDQEFCKQFDQEFDQGFCDNQVNLMSLAEKMKAPVVQIVVAGSWNSGKSAFINSLLKEEICPVRGNPTTSSITTIKHGNNLLIFKILGEGKKAEITLDEYHEMVTHKSGETDKTANERYEFEVYHPAEILKNVILVDTPGFANSQNSLDDSITQSSVTKADVILWLTDINPGQIKSNELKELESEQFKNHLGDKYLILTKADTKPPIKREQIHSDITKMLKEKKILFQDVLIHSSGEMNTDTDEFIYEFYQPQLCNLLVSSGNIADKLIKRSVHTHLDAYFVTSDLKFERIAEQVLPDESILSYMKSMEKSLLEEIGETWQRQEWRVEERLMKVFKPVEVSKEEKSYWLTPYAKIEINESERKNLYSIVRDFCTLGYNKCRVIITHLRKQGIDVPTFVIEFEARTINQTSFLIDELHAKHFTPKTQYFDDLAQATKHFQGLKSSVFHECEYSIFCLVSTVTKNNFDHIKECLPKSNPLQSKFEKVMADRKMLVNILQAA